MLKEISYPIIVRGQDGREERFYTKSEYNNYIKNLIIQADLKVLRDKKTGKALNVSYTEEGLKTTANKMGKYVYFNNVNRLSDIPNGKKSNNVIVEKFIPREFKDPQLQKIETHWLETAKFKIYNNY